MKQAILLLSNKTDFSVRSRYNKLIEEIGKKADIFLLFDGSTPVDKHDLEHFQRIYAFSVPELIKVGYTALENGFLGNCHYPILKFHKDYPEYDYCWLIEDDVMFSGNWRYFFDTFSEDTFDLLTTKIRKYKDAPNWYWWNSVKAPEGQQVSVDDLYASFNPIYRLSTKAIECLDIEMRKGWQGHFEALIPTIIAKYGLTMRDIGGNGSFVKKGMENKFYTESTHTWVPLLVQAIIPNMIYHPVKEKISKTTYRHYCLLSIVGEHNNRKAWTAENVDRFFDVHLIIQDLSFSKNAADADFAYGKVGSHTDLIRDYLVHHQYLLDQYDYFFIIDDMSVMTAKQINALFDDMKRNSCEFSLVGMTMPCFSRDLIKQLLNEDSEYSAVYFY